jgi:hypothetical protein
VNLGGVVLRGRSWFAPQSIGKLKFSLIREQPPLQLRDHSAQVLPRRTFPNHCHAPALIEQMSVDRRIALGVPLELGSPELWSCGGVSRELAVPVAVPEAAVDEDYRASSGKDEVGSTRQVGHIQTITEASCMEAPTHNEFRARILPRDTRHHSRSGLWVHNVGHASQLALGFRASHGK